MTRGQIRRARNREAAWTVLGLLLLLWSWRAWVEIEEPSPPLDLRPVKVKPVHSLTRLSRSWPRC